MSSNKDNSGSIFKNDYKQKDTHPDYKGKIVVDGVAKDIALWFNPEREGKKAYFSVKIEDPYIKPEQTTAPAEPADQESDGLPF